MGDGSAVAGMPGRPGDIGVRFAWSDALDRGPACLPVFGRFTGMGTIEAIAVGFDDGVRGYEVESGSVAWPMPWPGGQAPNDSASADIDGDGRDEAIFTVGSSIYCIGSSGSVAGLQAEVRWRIDLPATLGPPAVADTNGTGEATVVVPCAHG